MSDRERWVIYPLLFLAIGMATKNGVEFQAEQQMKETQSKMPIVRCKELLVLGDNDKPLVTITEASKQRGGVITVHNADGKPVTQVKSDATTGAGLFETANGNGTPQVVLSSNSNGGAVTLFDRLGKNIVQLAPPPPTTPKSTDGESETSKEKSSEPSP